MEKVRVGIWSERERERTCSLSRWVCSTKSFVFLQTTVTEERTMGGGRGEDHNGTETQRDRFEHSRGSRGAGEDREAERQKSRESVNSKRKTEGGRGDRLGDLKRDVLLRRRTSWSNQTSICFHIQLQTTQHSTAQQQQQRDSKRVGGVRGGGRGEARERNGLTVLLMILIVIAPPFPWTIAKVLSCRQRDRETEERGEHRPGAAGSTGEHRKETGGTGG
jgi:hypothetical protein